jgi:glycosyltransferase involved in cell wall biosynthesis
LKIAIVTPFYPSRTEIGSGIGNHFRHLALALRELGHDVTVFYFPYEGRENASYLQEGIPIQKFGFPLPQWPRFRVLGRIAKLLAYQDWHAAWNLYRITTKTLLEQNLKEKFDVIETTSNRGLAYGISRSALPHPPIVTRVSTTMSQAIEENREEVDLHFRLEAKLERGLIRRSDALVTHTKAHALTLHRELGTPADSYYIIPHGIALPSSLTAPKKVGDKGDLCILYAGRFERRKGTDVLLESIPAVLAEIPNARFILAGQDQNGRYQKEFEALNSTQVTSRVSFRGCVTDEELNTLYGNCDLFVAPSRYESFGLVYVEAMSYGKPVVGCNSGGIPEVVANGKTGLLPPPGNPQALTHAILTLLTDKILRRQFGKAGRKHVLDLFGREKMAGDTINLYRNIINSRKKRCA